jgi:hypothetical protein
MRKGQELNLRRFYPIMFSKHTRPASSRHAIRINRLWLDIYVHLTKLDIHPKDQLVLHLKFSYPHSTTAKRFVKSLTFRLDTLRN